jgi:NTE family protein
MFNPLKYFRNRKVGLALGSGGSRGIAHIAVIERLQSMNIPIHRIAGSSIGAVVGALYSAGSLADFKRDLLKMKWSEMVALADPVFPRSGMFAGKKVMQFLGRYLPGDGNIEDLPVPLTVVATDYYTGRPVLFTKGNIRDALRASISIPGVFTPVRYGDTFLIDGGVANPLPVNVLYRMDARLSIAVNLHPTLLQKPLKKLVRRVIRAGRGEAQEGESDGDGPIGFLTPSKRSPANWLKSIENWLGVGLEKKEEYELKDPNIVSVITQSIDIMEYVHTDMLLKHYRPTVLVQPDLPDLQSLDFTQAPRALDEGNAACERVRGQITRRIRYWS